MKYLPKGFRCLALVIALVAPAANLTSCAAPFSESSEEELRNSLIQTHRDFQRVIAQGEVTIERDPSEVEQILRERKDGIKELDSISGASSYEGTTPALGSDLHGKASKDTVGLSLQDAIGYAVRNNIDYRVVRLSPAIAQQQVTRAQAVFDATLFSNFSFSTLDTPQPAGPIIGIGGDQQTENWTLETGIRKALTTGGNIQVSTTVRSVSQVPTFSAMNPYWDADLLVSIQQPLLKGFGTDINKASIRLQRLAKRSAEQEVRATLIQTINDTETAYWLLYRRWQELLIQERLLERTVKERKRLKERLDFDVKPSDYTDALAREESRRANLISARQRVRSASDALKRLIESEDLPLAGEAIIQPTDKPADAPLTFSLLDAVTTALRERPEMQQALLQIKDAGIRQRVADNNRLPTLDLTASVNFNAIETSPGEAIGDIFTEADYIDYALGLEFAYPIGNRDAQALYQQRTLERRQSVLAYQRQARDVVLEVKDSMRNLIAAYELIGATRSSRRAAAENLRAIQVEEDAGRNLTPDFIDRKLTRQAQLAEAELAEVEAIINYNTSISSFFAAMGTLLDRNNIEFETEE